MNFTNNFIIFKKIRFLAIAIPLFLVVSLFLVGESYSSPEIVKYGTNHNQNQYSLVTIGLDNIVIGLKVEHIGEVDMVAVLIM